MKPSKKATSSLVADCETCFRLSYLKSLGIDSKHSESLIKYSVMHSLASEAAFSILNFQRIDDPRKELSDLLNSVESRLKIIDDYNLEQCLETLGNKDPWNAYSALEDSKKKEFLAKYKSNLSSRLKKAQEHWINSNSSSFEKIMQKLELDELKVLYIREYGSYKSFFTEDLVGRPDGIVFFKQGSEKEIKIAPFEIKPHLDSRGIVQNASYHILLSEKLDYIKTLFERETGMPGKNLVLADDLWFMEYEKMGAGIIKSPASIFTPITRTFLNLVNSWIRGEMQIPSAEEFFGKNDFCPRCYVRERCSSELSK